MSGLRPELILQNITIHTQNQAPAWKRFANRWLSWLPAAFILCSVLWAAAVLGDALRLPVPWNLTAAACWMVAACLIALLVRPKLKATALILLSCFLITLMWRVANPSHNPLQILPSALSPLTQPSSTPTAS